MNIGIDDTIVAVSSPIGAAWRTVIRLSGVGAADIVGRIIADAHSRDCLAGKGGRTFAASLRLPDGRRLRTVIFIMRSPRSYTGEDLVEIHLVGSTCFSDELIVALIAAGARLAEPGEFTRRAFLSGKMDIVAAEAVLATIQATSTVESSAAAEILTGRFSAAVSAMECDICDLLAELEASLDFSDHDIPEIDRDAFARRLAGLRSDIASLIADEQPERGSDRRFRVILFGPVNVGKSTLYNRLTGSPNAITSDIPGTTRDLLESPVEIDNLPVTLIDSAGQWEFPSGPPSGADAIAIDMALKAVRSADLVLIILDVADLLPYGRIAPAISPLTSIVALNKIDRYGTPVEGRRTAKQAADAVGIGDYLAISTHEGWGLDELRSRIASTIRQIPASVSGGRLTILRRWSETLQRAGRALSAADQTIAGGGDISVASIELTAAARAVGEMTGSTIQEEVLDRIFSRFCIGK